MQLGKKATVNFFLNHKIVGFSDTKTSLLGSEEVNPLNHFFSQQFFVIIPSIDYEQIHGNYNTLIRNQVEDAINYILSPYSSLILSDNKNEHWEMLVDAMLDLLENAIKSDYGLAKRKNSELIPKEHKYGGQVIIESILDPIRKKITFKIKNKGFYSAIDERKILRRLETSAKRTFDFSKEISEIEEEKEDSNFGRGKNGVFHARKLLESIGIKLEYEPWFNNFYTLKFEYNYSQQDKNYEEILARINKMDYIRNINIDLN